MQLVVIEQTFVRVAYVYFLVPDLFCPNDWLNDNKCTTLHGQFKKGMDRPLNFVKMLSMLNTFSLIFDSET